MNEKYFKRLEFAKLKLMVRTGELNSKSVMMTLMEVIYELLHT